MDYMTLKEASEKWGVTTRWINYLCTAGRIPGAVKMGTVWLIPKGSDKPADRRRKKKLLLLVFISVVILGIEITFAVSHFHAKSQTRKAITKISEKMHDFMQSEKEAVEVFPKEYAEISTQMVEIKSTMQRHEQILKEEAARKNDYSPYAILVDLDSGTVLKEKNSTDRIYPASLTKIMTAILAIENTEDLEEIVQLPDEIFPPLYAQNASMAGFQPGEEVRLKDLLYGVLIPSGAECCLAFADRISGSEEEFVSLMNDKAQELGMKNTHFTNSTGLHDPEHYSTVEDISILLQYALKNEYFRDVFTSSRYSTLPSEQHPEGFTFHSTMFKYMDSTEVTGGEILGGKTGYTEEAGLCLASLAQVNGKEYILVTAKANGTHQTEQFHILDAINVYSQIGEAGQNTYE